MPSRSEILLMPLQPGARVIEIGPSFSPIAPKAAGWDARTLDHLTREGLVANTPAIQALTSVESRKWITFGVVAR